MKALVTFISSGGIVLDADSLKDVRAVFENLDKDLLLRELEQNGISIADIQILE